LLLHNLDRTWPFHETQQILRQIQAIKSALGLHGHTIVDLPIHDALLSMSLVEYDPKEYVVLNWCEGLPGVLHSEALVAETLETMDYVFTGSGADALALSWDKKRVKQALVRQEVPTPLWRVFDSPDTVEWSRFPAIVKPVYEHCSLGMTPESVVFTLAGLRERIRHVKDTFRQPALVEDFIDGREFHVTLWENGAIQMLPPAEMDFSAFTEARDRLCTFDSKFRPGSRHYEGIQLRLPAPLSREELKALQRAALAAYRAIGCRDYARIDIRLREGVFYVLDVNPNPDLCEDTSMTSSAEAAGYSYGEMLSHLVRLAALRHPVFGARPSAAVEVS
jgi:D-alanine-D-alanine ligase